MSKSSDDDLRARIYAKFVRIAEETKLYAVLSRPGCCSGRGLVVGCPVCKRRWPS